MCGGPARRLVSWPARQRLQGGGRAQPRASPQPTLPPVGRPYSERACTTLASGPSAASSAAWQHTRACSPCPLQVHPGENVGCGKDYTLYALMEGVVVFEKKSRQQLVNVVPFEDYVIPEVGGGAALPPGLQGGRLQWSEAAGCTYYRQWAIAAGIWTAAGREFDLLDKKSPLQRFCWPGLVTLAHRQHAVSSQRVCARRGRKDSSSGASAQHIAPHLSPNPHALPHTYTHKHHHPLRCVQGQRMVEGSRRHRKMVAAEQRREQEAAALAEAK